MGMPSIRLFCRRRGGQLARLKQEEQEECWPIHIVCQQQQSVFPTISYQSFGGGGTRRMSRTVSSFHGGRLSLVDTRPISMSLYLSSPILYHKAPIN